MAISVSGQFPGGSALTRLPENKNERKKGNSKRTAVAAADLLRDPLGDPRVQNYLSEKFDAKPAGVMHTA
jgi:hypothetical protein